MCPTLRDREYATAVAACAQSSDSVWHGQRFRSTAPARRRFKRAQGNGSQSAVRALTANHAGPSPGSLGLATLSHTWERVRVSSAARHSESRAATRAAPTRTRLYLECSSTARHSDAGRRSTLSHTWEGSLVSLAARHSEGRAATRAAPTRTRSYFGCPRTALHSDAGRAPQPSPTCGRGWRAPASRVRAGAFARSTRRRIGPVHPFTRSPAHPVTLSPRHLSSGILTPPTPRPTFGSHSKSSYLLASPLRSTDTDLHRLTR
jgi:hypothetical protein